MTKSIRPQEIVREIKFRSEAVDASLVIRGAVEDGKRQLVSIGLSRRDISTDPKFAHLNRKGENQQWVSASRSGGSFGARYDGRSGDCALKGREFGLLVRLAEASTAHVFDPAIFDEFSSTAGRKMEKDARPRIVTMTPKAPGGVLLGDRDYTVFEGDRAFNGPLVALEHPNPIGIFEGLDDIEPSLTIPGGAVTIGNTL